MTECALEKPGARGLLYGGRNVPFFALLQIYCNSCPGKGSRLRHPQYTANLAMQAAVKTRPDSVV